MWETILIAVIPSALATIITYLVNKKKYNTEVSKLEHENMSIRTENSSKIYEMYNKQLDLLSNRLNDYITESTLSYKKNKEKIDSLENIIEAKDKKINELERRVNSLIKEVCVTKGCTKRTFLNDNVKQTKSKDND